MLAVVDDQQALPPGECLDEAVFGARLARSAGALDQRDPGDAGKGLRHEIWVAHGCEVHEGGAIGETDTGE